MWNIVFFNHIHLVCACMMLENVFTKLKSFSLCFITSQTIMQQKYQYIHTDSLTYISTNMRRCLQGSHKSHVINILKPKFVKLKLSKFGRVHGRKLGSKLRGWRAASPEGRGCRSAGRGYEMPCTPFFLPHQQNTATVADQQYWPLTNDHHLIT